MRHSNREAEGMAMRVKALRKSLGLSQSQVAEEIGVDQSNVSRWEHGAMPEDTHIVRMAELAGVHPAEFRYGALPEAEALEAPARSVPVVGYVGAGQTVFSHDDHALGSGLEEVEGPEGVGEGSVVAVRVRGDSMHPMRNGWLLFYRRDQEGVPDDCLNRLCVVKLADDGPILVKELHRGYQPSSYLLASWNAPPMEDVEIEWAAAVLSIRP